MYKVLDFGSMGLFMGPIQVCDFKEMDMYGNGLVSGLNLWTFMGPVEGLRLWANGHLWNSSRVLGFGTMDIYHDLWDQFKVSDFEPMGINRAHLDLRFWNNRYFLETPTKF